MWVNPSWFLIIVNTKARDDSYSDASELEDEDTDEFEDGVSHSEDDDMTDDDRSKSADGDKSSDDMKFHFGNVVWFCGTVE